MRSLLVASLAGALLVTSTGCITARAKTPTVLNMPEPPARVVTPPSIPVEPPPPVAAEPPTPTAPTTPPGGTTPPNTPPPPRPAAQNTATPPTAPPPDNPPVLQTTSGKDTQELENRTRWQLDSAKRELDRLDPKHLGRDAQAQYYAALRMYTEAEDAFKRKNFNYAFPQAQKAALMASLIPKGRQEPFPTSP